MTDQPRPPESTPRWKRALRLAVDVGTVVATVATAVAAVYRLVREVLRGR